MQYFSDDLPWLVGLMAITFSDDVYYLLPGTVLQGTMEFSGYHFSTRLGGLYPCWINSVLFLEMSSSCSPTISLIQLFRAHISYFLRITKRNKLPWLCCSLCFCTQGVISSIFLTKVYPDFFLIFWVCLFICSVYRNSRNSWQDYFSLRLIPQAFRPTETITFLAPFPILACPKLRYKSTA